MPAAIRLALVAVPLSFAMPAAAATDPATTEASSPSQSEPESPSESEGPSWAQIVTACLGIFAGVAIAGRQIAARKS